MDKILKLDDVMDASAFELKAANLQLFRVVDDLKTVVNQRNKARQEMAGSHFDAMYLLALGADFREGRNGLRLVRIGATAEILAKAAGMSDDYCSEIRQAAPLYDIGMVAIPDALLHKAEDLSDEEWKLWRSHTEIGARIMSSTFDTPIMKMAAEIALTHHENFGGKGYPAGLTGQDIPLSGRIVALAEYFETQTNALGRRPQAALPADMVLTSIQDLSGRRFDPELVGLFFANLPVITEAHAEIESKASSFHALVANSRPDMPISGTTEAP